MVYGRDAEPKHVIIPGPKATLARCHSNGVHELQLDGGTELVMVKNIRGHAKWDETILGGGTLRRSACPSPDMAPPSGHRSQGRVDGGLVRQPDASQASSSTVSSPWTGALSRADAESVTVARSLFCRCTGALTRSSTGS